MKYSIRSLQKRGTGTWEASFYHRDPVTGKRICTYHTIKARSKQSAERLRDELRVRLELEGTQVATQTRVGELLDSYVDYKADSGTVEASTVKDYRYSANFVRKYIGDVVISDLTTEDVNGMMAAALKEGYAPKSISKPFRLLKQALKDAVMRDVISKNVCDFCTPPRRTKDEINALTRAEATRMLELAKLANPARLALAITLALTTGMRRGEICGLKWSDIDFERSELTVRHALAVCEGGYYLKDPKTHKSRTIPLIPDTASMLKAVREHQEASWRRIGTKAPDYYVCGSTDDADSPYNPALLGKEFKGFCSMNGFECTFHDLRHTFATLMISSGVDVRTVSSYLGHASPAMTLDVYASVDPDAKRAAVGKIQSIYSEPLVRRGVEAVSGSRSYKEPMTDSPLLTQEAPKEKNLALELLMSEKGKDLTDEEKLMLLDLARR